MRYKQYSDMKNIQMHKALGYMESFGYIKISCWKENLIRQLISYIYV